MLSMPPATMISALPAMMVSLAKITACNPDPHILLTVVASTFSGRPAPSAACRAGAWPSPAASTQPMTTRSIFSGSTPARLTVSCTAAAPRAVAFTPDSWPRKLPIGVRA